MEVGKKMKGFWEKPEGTTGMIFAVGLVGVVGFLLWKFLPFIIGLFQNLLHAIILGIVIFAIVYVLVDPRTRNLLFFMYKSVMKKVTGIFIEIDPIGIIENYVDTLKDNLAKINKQISNLRGKIEMLTREIKQNARKMEENFKMVQAAKKSGNKKYAMNAKLALKSSGRLDKSNITLKELLVKLEGLYRILNKTHDAAQFLIADIEDEVHVKKQERKAVLAGHSAIKSAMKIINPSDDKKALFDQALEFMAEDIGNKVGDIEHFMEISEDFMNGVDLQNGVFEEEGLALLEQWEESDSALLGKDKKKILAQAKDDRQVLDLDRPVEKVAVANRTNQFEGLFKTSQN